MTSRKSDADLELEKFEKKLKLIIKYVMFYALTFTAIIFIIYGSIEFIAQIFWYRLQGFSFIFGAYILIVLALLFKLQIRKRDGK